MPSDHNIIKLKNLLQNDSWKIPKYLESNQVQQSAPEHPAKRSLGINPFLFHSGILA